MIALLIIVVWTLMFTLAISRMNSINIRSTWQVVGFFIVAPILNIVVLIGWGVVGYMSEDWENLL
jgi:hypothetical protein